MRTTTRLLIVGMAWMIVGPGPLDRDETVFFHKPFLVLADCADPRAETIASGLHASLAGVRARIL